MSDGYPFEIIADLEDVAHRLTELANRKRPKYTAQEMVDDSVTLHRAVYVIKELLKAGGEMRG